MLGHFGWGGGVGKAAVGIFMRFSVLSFLSPYEHSFFFSYIALTLFPFLYNTNKTKKLQL
jgi:hypothetical protein